MRTFSVLSAMVPLVVGCETVPVETSQIDETQPRCKKIEITGSLLPRCSRRDNVMTTTKDDLDRAGSPQPGPEVPASKTMARKPAP